MENKADEVTLEEASVKATVKVYSQWRVILCSWISAVGPPPPKKCVLGALDSHRCIDVLISLSRQCIKTKKVVLSILFPFRVEYWETLLCPYSLTYVPHSTVHDQQDV